MAALKFHKTLPTIEKITAILIQEAIKRTNGNRAKAARILGISEQTLGRRVRKDRSFVKHFLLAFLLVFWGAVSNGQADTGYVEGQVVVNFEADAAQAAIDDLIAAHDLTIVESIPQIQYYVLRVPTGKTVGEIVDTLESYAIVSKCEPNYLTGTLDVPDDNLFNHQWGLQNTENEGVDLHIRDAWEIESGSPDTIVAVIDMGFDITHEDLQENIWHNPGEIAGNNIDDDGNGYVDDIVGWDFVNQPSGLDDPNADWRNEDNDPSTTLSSHGNRVLGVIGATVGNGIGIAGVAGDCKMMLIRAGFHTTEGTPVLSSSHIARGIIYAADNGARVINISSGSTRFSNTYYAALRYAINKGVVIVCSAGNEGASTPVYPAAYDLAGLISVGASTSQDTRSWFSNYGDWVDVSAPGSRIMTTLLGDAYGSTQGTSFAAPMVAGVAALLVSANPDWTAAQVQDQIMNTVDTVPALEGASISSGRVNAHRALLSAPASAESTGAVSSGSASAPAASSGGGGGGCFIAASGTGQTPYGVLFLLSILSIGLLGSLVRNREVAAQRIEK
jgi:subtilisin family serine protease